MAKKVLIISSSPRKGGNSELLCDEFMKDALEADNEVEKIFLKDKTETNHIMVKETGGKVWLMKGAAKTLRK